MSKPHVLVLGAGFAGLETAFLIHHRLHDEVKITVVSESDTFLFRPNTIYIPFGADPKSLEVPLEEAFMRRHIDFIEGRARHVDPETRQVELENGDTHTADFVVVATGAAMRPSEIPGLAEHANTIWTPKDMLRLRETVDRMVHRGEKKEKTRVLFLIPPNNKCAGPLYEIVQMLETHLRRKHVRESVELTWATNELGYIQAFGLRLHEAVTKEFAERKITGHLGRRVKSIEKGTARFEDGGSLEFDELIAFPPYVANVSYESLPSDERGFVRTELESRRVVGAERVYAPGDAGDFPVKQAFLAFLEADAVAEDIVGQIRGKEPRTKFDPVSMCVMEQFDKATFAQVPLRLTGDPARPVEVRPGAEDLYKVGVSPLWRIGKKLLGVYLPMRFGAGEPFHAGTAWKMMDVGLLAMSGVLAD